MDQELKYKWITALRSGDYQQGVGRLKSNRDSYCCLGVLCDVSGLGEWVMPDGLTHPKYSFSAGGYDWLLDLDLMGYGVSDHLDVPMSTQMTLIDMNDDDELSFDQIADWIEENL